MTTGTSHSEQGWNWHGGISLSGRAVVDSMAELIGFKLGLTVSEDDLLQAVKARGAEELWPDETDSF
jgi:restriction system protein